MPCAANNSCPLHFGSRGGEAARVDAFWMDATDVTNAEFVKFVNENGYVTIAEPAPTKEEFPTAPPENLVAGSIVFTPTPQLVSLTNHYQ